MKKIDNKTWERFTEAHAKLSEAKAEAEALIEATNAKLAELADAANAARDEALSALDDAATEAETYYDERSEKWQEGDAGQAYSEWKDELANARDALGEDISLEIDTPEGFDALDECLNTLDGGFRQSPDE